MAAQPTLSVIVPVYNMARFAEKGIREVLTQTGVEMELILVDDGSTDDSAQLIGEAIKGHENARLIRTENRGSGPARNTGIAAAVGEYLYFFDIDDSLQKGALARMTQAAVESGCDLLVCGYETIQGDKVIPHGMRAGVVSGGEARKEYDRYMGGDQSLTGAPWNKLFKRETIIQNKLEYPALRRHQDEVFNMRYMNVAKSVCIIPDILYHYYANNQARMWEKYRLDYWENVEKLMGFYHDIIIAWNPENKKVRKNVAQLYLIRAIDAMRVLFNPKWHLSHIKRFGMLKKQLALYRKNVGELVPMSEIDTQGRKLFSLMNSGKSALLVYLALMRETSRKDSLGV